MKTFQLLLCTLFGAALSLAQNSAAFAQTNSLPAKLSEKSSLADVLNRLGKTSFVQARIGLNAEAPEVETGDVITTATRYSERAVFAQGFRLAKIDGCRITLRNNRAELIDFSTKYPNPADGSLDDVRKIQNNQSRFTGEFFISLQKLKAGKAPYRHTKKTDKADLLGTWRTEFKIKSEFFLFPTQEKLKTLSDNSLKIEIIGAGREGRNDSMNGDTITFTFVDKQMSENFYAAFNQAITLCKDE